MMLMTTIRRDLLIKLQAGLSLCITMSCIPFQIKIRVFVCKWPVEKLHAFYHDLF